MAIVGGLKQETAFGILTEVAEKEKMRKRRAEQDEIRRKAIRENEDRNLGR